ncbi:MAG: T9SS type A sorting domain-containing protein [Bacteroidota bacterium]
MKRVFTLAFLIALTTGVYAQAFLKNINVQTTETEILGQEVQLNGYLSVLFTNPTDDGGFMIFSSYEPSGSHARNLSIQKVNDKGEPEWTKSYPDLFVLTHEPRPDVAIQPTEDGGYVGVFGEGFFNDFTLVRFDDQGEIVWAKATSTQQNGHFSYTQAFGITELVNGDVLYLTGQVYNGFMVMVRLDGMTGEKIAEKRVGINSIIGITDLVPTQDGGALVLAQMEAGNHTDFDVIVMKWGADNSVEWARRFNEVENIFPVAAYEREDGFVFFARMNNALLTYNLDPATGQQKQAKAYLLEVGTRPHDPFLPLNRHGDKVFFSGIGFDPLSAENTSLFWQFDMKTLSFDWMLRNASGQGNAYFQNERFAQYQDGELLAIRGEGSVFVQKYAIHEGIPTACEGNTYERVDMRVIEGSSLSIPRGASVTNTTWINLVNAYISHDSFEAVAQMICEEEAAVEEEQEEEEEVVVEEEEKEPLELMLDVTIAPNPTAGQVRIAMPGYEDMQLELNLFDASGKWISKKVQLIDGLIDYDFSALPAGAYYLRFQTDSDVFTKRVVKINP